ncbi:hypothetical protein BHM03_00042938, partial [Ensete ventricosum]
VLGSLSRRGAPADPRVTKALETMKSCYSSDSTLKAHRLVEFFFISCSQGWGFRLEWTAQLVNQTTPALSDDESKMVGILQGILSSSRVMRDMTKAWLVEAGLSLAPRARGSSGSGCPKCPNAGEDDQPRKKSIVTVSKQSASSGNGSAKAHLDKGKDPADKGKEPTEVEEPEQGYTLWELCKVDDYAGADQYLAARMSKLP